MSKIRKEWHAAAKCYWTTAYFHTCSGLEALARKAVQLAEEAERNADAGTTVQAPRYEAEAGCAIPLHVSVERKAYVTRKLS